MSAPAAPAAAAAPAAPSLPSSKILEHAAKFALEQDKPILLDYYLETRSGKAFIGQDKDTKEQILVKSADEYTSSIQRLLKAGDDYIVITENSIYIVSGNTKRKDITGLLKKEEDE